MDTYSGEQRTEREIENIVSTDRFRPDRGFLGAEKSLGGEAQVQQRRDGPVQFERSSETSVSMADDPFGLDRFLTEAKKGKQAIASIGQKGTMHARADGTAGSFGSDSIVGRGKSQRQVEFEHETDYKRVRHRHHYQKDRDGPSDD